MPLTSARHITQPSGPQSPATAKFIAAATSSSYKHRFSLSDYFRLALFIRWGRSLHRDSGVRSISPHVKRQKKKGRKILRRSILSCSPTQNTFLHMKHIKCSSVFYTSSKKYVVDFQSFSFT